MKFQEQLNEYMMLTDATVSSLSQATGLSVSVISRYKSGKRVPAADSEQIRILAKGLEGLAEKKGVVLLEVLETLSGTLETDSYDAAEFAKKLDELLAALDIHNAELAKKLQYDPSYISKLRLGKRRPADISDFVSRLCNYIVRYIPQDKIRSLTFLLECGPEEMVSPDSFYLVLSNYFYAGSLKQHTETLDFLKALDDFDLNDYIKSIRFDELKVPTAPFHLPKAKNYYGIEEMKEAELDFERATVLSKSKEPVFMCSDMPIDSYVDEEFPKKWMMGLALILKKGLRIQIIHHLDRSFRDLMLGLEAWLPLYMTGQVSPYYLEGAANLVYRHILYTSGAAALSGEGIAGKDASGKKYVTNNKRELEYYQKRGKELLDRARPLMEIYREEQRGRFAAFLKTMQESEQTRHNRLPGLSLPTLPLSLLEEILETSGSRDAQKEEIMELADQERKSYERVLIEHEITEIVPVLAEADYENTPMYLPLSALFPKQQIKLSYAQYLAHLEAARAYGKAHKNYHLIETDTLDFPNILIQVVIGKYALVSKTNAPMIHFVIRHPLLVDAIENMVIPIKE